MLTILMGDVAGSAGADAGRSAQPAPWPPLDLFESWRSFLVRVDVPGIKTGDLEVAFAGGLLLVSGARYRFPSQCAALQGGGEGTPRRQAWC